MNNQSNIEQVVMRRVHTIRFLRVIISSGALATVVCVLALWSIGREVWVARVFTNGPQDFAGHFFYLMYAFERTRLIVQALSLLTLASLIYIAREIARAFSFMFAPMRA